MIDRREAGLQEQQVGTQQEVRGPEDLSMGSTDRDSLQGSLLDDRTVVSW